MTDIVKGMRAAFEADLIRQFGEDGGERVGDRVDQTEAMRAALLWLSENVSDEMVSAYEQLFYGSYLNTRKDAIAAALRAAAGEASK